MRGEWTDQVKRDLESFGIPNELDWIKVKSKWSFKALVKKQAREVAIETLIDKKETHSRMEDLEYSELSMQK